MFNKTITSDFFTTINFNLFLKSLNSITLNLSKLRKGNNIEIFSREFLSYLGLEKSKLISFYNGRSALYNCLKLIGVTNKDEVIVNGFTCVSVSNAVIQTGAKIVYSDIDKKNFGFDIKKLEEKITKKTKVILVQHTFGKDSNIKKIIKIANNYNLIVIEDCAHSLGTKIDKEHLGTFGDFSIFSTGRDKVISSVTGGFLIINNKKYFKKISDIESNLNYPTIGLTIKNHFYNLVAYKAHIFYDIFGLGKLFIYLSKKLNLIPDILNNEEKKCNYNSFNYKLPNSLVKLALGELEKIKLYNNHRRLLAEYFDKSIKNKDIKIGFDKLKNEKNNYFRYPILIKDKKIYDDFYNYMKKNNVLLGKSWSNSPIAPIGSDLELSKYELKDNPISEKITKSLYFLPNHPLVTLRDAEKVVQLINNYKF